MPSISQLYTVFVFQQPPATSLKQSVKDRLGPMLPQNSGPGQESGAASQVCVGGLAEDVFCCVYLSKFAQGLYKHFPPFWPPPHTPFVQNPTKLSVKDRLGFCTKPAAPIEKVSLHSVFRSLCVPFKMFSFSCKCNCFLSVSGVFNIHGTHKDCVQSCCPEDSTKNLRGSFEEETGEKWMEIWRGSDL